MIFASNIKQAFSQDTDVASKDKGGLVETVLLIAGFAIVAIALVSWIGNAIAGQAANISACVAESSSAAEACTEDTYGVSDSVSDQIASEGGKLGVKPPATGGSGGGGSTPTPTPTPTPTTTPVMAAGSVSVAATGYPEKITATRGSGWSPTPDSCTYQWLRNGATISGATASTYTITPANDGGKTITVRMTCAKTGYTSASKVSAGVAIPPMSSGPAAAAVKAGTGYSYGFGSGSSGGPNANYSAEDAMAYRAAQEAGNMSLYDSYVQGRNDGIRDYMCYAGNPSYCVN